VRLRLSTNGIRTIEHNGGLDAFLLDTADSKLTIDARALKRRILQAKAKREASSR
jgi:large subunit ribosomal protein L28